MVVVAGRGGGPGRLRGVLAGAIAVHVHAELVAELELAVLAAW